MRIGVDYYPEHWDKERWKTDAEMMVRANIKVIRIGEFAWSLYEPEEGKYEFGWMDEALDFFGSYGIKVILCTPSATPPKWMVDKYPEILQDDIHGNSKLFGTRKHYCFNNDLYREKNKALITLIAQRYGEHPVVEGWQIDNELGWANTTRCYCQSCEKKFRAFLKNKYGNIENLNKKYGTVFWSQIYDDFEQVIIPKAGACYDTCHDTQGQNPGLLLDYYRFASDSVIEFTKFCAEIIRKYSKLPITSNLLDAAVNSGTGIDYFKLSRELDFVTWDNYIEFQWGKAEKETVSRDHALLRSYKKQPFWVMEQQSGPCGWSKMGPTPTPGKLRLWTYQATAQGADTVVYFRWRACPYGTEELWHGILNHDGKPNRRYEEITRIGHEMEKLSQHYGPLMPKARVAIVKSFDSEWSQSIHRQVENLYYDKLLLDYYRPFSQMGISVDFVEASEKLDEYNLVIAPMLMLSTEEEQKNLEDYTKRGGHLVLTFRSGIKDMYNNMLQETVPGCFSELAGIEIEDYDPLLEKSTEISGVFGKGKASMWCDIIKPVTAKTLGIYTSDFYNGVPCFTENNVGAGSVYYVGCDLDQEAQKMLSVYLGRKSGIHMDLYQIDGVETVDATDGEKEALFVLNHNEYPVTVPVETKCKDLLNEKDVEKVLVLEPFGVAVLDRN